MATRLGDSPSYIFYFWRPIRDGGEQVGSSLRVDPARVVNRVWSCRHGLVREAMVWPRPRSGIPRP